MATMADPSLKPIPIPSLDGHRSSRLFLRFSGAGELDAFSSDDLQLLEGARLGGEIRLIVVGEVDAKGFKLQRVDDESSLAFTTTVRVISVEAGEIA